MGKGQPAQLFWWCGVDWRIHLFSWRTIRRFRIKRLSLHQSRSLGQSTHSKSWCGLEYQRSLPRIFVSRVALWIAQCTRKYCIQTYCPTGQCPLPHLQSNTGFSSKIKVLKTPPESPNLNPIENLWHEMKHFVRTTAKPRNRGTLAGIQSFWATMTLEKCCRYIDHLKWSCSQL